MRGGDHGIRDGLLARATGARDIRADIPRGEAQPQVDQLQQWLETRHGGCATSREIQRAHVGGVRSAKERDALLAEYEEVYPGTVREERTGSRGPAGTVVHAPARGKSESREPPVLRPGKPVMATVSPDTTISDFPDDDAVH